MSLSSAYMGSLSAWALSGPLVRSPAFATMRKTAKHTHLIRACSPHRIQSPQRKMCKCNAALAGQACLFFGFFGRLMQMGYSCPQKESHP